MAAAVLEAAGVDSSSGFSEHLEEDYEWGVSHFKCKDADVDGVFVSDRDFRFSPGVLTINRSFGNLEGSAL